VNNRKRIKYPLLEAVIAKMSQPLQPTYSNRDIARVFGVSIEPVPRLRRLGKLVTYRFAKSAMCKAGGLDVFIDGSQDE
jgi:hypothetical protein